MKKLLALLMLLAIGAGAQTPVTPPPTFFQTVGNYFTAFNTNLDTFNADHFDISIGSTTINNNQLSADFLVEFQAFKAFSVEADIRNTTVAGTVISYQGGVGYNFTKWDTRVTGSLDAGYNTVLNEVYIAPSLRVKKALTPNTYAGVGVELDAYFHRQPISPTYTIFTGFKF